MSFTEDVRNRRVPWSTQRQFKADSWVESAVRAGSGADDLLLGMSGLWVSDVLSELRPELSSPLWQCGFARTGRALIGEVNRGLVVMREHLRRVVQGHDGPLFKSDFSVRYSPVEGLPGVDLEAQVEVAVDSLDRSLTYVMRACGTGAGGAAGGTLDIMELLRLWRSLGTYAQIEQLFYEILWGEVRLSFHAGHDAWHILPCDGEQALTWHASMDRLEAHVQEIMLTTRHLWKRSPELRRGWYKRTGGTPIFSCRRAGERFIVQYKRRKVAPPDEPPMSELLGTLALDLLSSEDIDAKRAAGFSLRDVMLVYECLTLLGHQLSAMQQDVAVTTEEGIARFAPALERASLVLAICGATNLPGHVVNAIVAKLTWQPDGAPGLLWHTPLVPFDLDGAAVLCPVLLPLMHSNPHRFVEHWLTELGFDLGERGPAFERHVQVRLLRAVDSRFASHVSVWRPGRLDADDGTYEEIDLLLRLNDRFVLVELKCNKFPDNPTAQNNYIDDLKKGAAQALRKSSWVLAHRAELVARFPGLEEAKQIFPLVMSNQPLGVGIQLHGVSVVDLILMEWYLGRPYISIGKAFPGSGQIEEIRLPSLYTDAEGLGQAFASFAERPPPLLQHRRELHLEDVPYMLKTVLGKHIIRRLAITANAPTVHPGGAAKVEPRHTR